MINKKSSMMGGRVCNTERAERRRDVLDRFERTTELPLLVLSLFLIPLLIAPLLFDFPEGVDAGILALEWLVWSVFTFEYVVRFVLTDGKWRFVGRNWMDLVVIAVPFLRPLRIARSARALRLLRLTRLVALLTVVNREARRILVRHNLHWALLTIGVVVLGAAALMTVVEERASGSSIRNFGDALWWAVVTITTVGYGDTYPVSAAGRGIAAVVMLAGITLFGLLTANLAAVFLERGGVGQGTDSHDGEQLSEKLDELLTRVARIETAIATERDERRRSERLTLTGR